MVRLGGYYMATIQIDMLLTIMDTTHDYIWSIQNLDSESDTKDNLP